MITHFGGGWLDERDDDDKSYYPITLCIHCDHCWIKDLFGDGTEMVYICGLDNGYIGYPDEAAHETMSVYKQ